MKKSILIAGAFFSALAFTPAFADTAGPTDAQARAAINAEPVAPVSDSELRAYAAAKVEIEHVYTAPAHNAEESARLRGQTAAVLMRHNLTATRYNEISTALDVNANLARRYAAITTDRRAGL